MEQSMQMQQPLLERVDKRPHGCSHWPLVVRFFLSVLSYPVTCPNRKCIEHASMSLDSTEFRETPLVGRYDSHSINETGNASHYGSTTNAENCPVCQSLNPPCNSSIQAKVRGRAWKIRMLWFAVLSALLTINYVQHLVISWAKLKFALYILSYSSYFGPIVVIVVYRLIACLIRCPPTGTKSFYAMTDENVLSLLHRVNLRDMKLHGYCFFIGPTINALLLTAFQIYHVSTNCPKFDGWGMVAYISEVIGFFVFAAFWYLVLLMRKALQRDLKSTCAFLKLHASDNSVSRHRLMESFVEYLRLDHLISGWMIFQIAINTFKFSCHVYWSFHLNSYEGQLIALNLLSIQIWFQVSMYFLFPLVAADGLNIQYVWLKFMALVEYEQGERGYWPSFKMLKHLKPVKSNVILTLAFSILGAFLSLHLTDQWAKFWTADSICYTIND
ncbi:uncharacterized protein [Ptychodera flava]|uniref:uncharacterized protein n=1 Tax=Ptychodera flava TaxID=63121 RepID=UPI00396A17B8